MLLSIVNMTYAPPMIRNIIPNANTAPTSPDEPPPLVLDDVILNPFIVFAI